MRSPPGDEAVRVAQSWAASDDAHVSAKAKQLLAAWAAGAGSPRP